MTLTNSDTYPIQPAIMADVPVLKDIVNKAYRGELSSRSWTSEAHLVSGARIDKETLYEYLNDDNSAILKHTAADGQIQGCVYLNQTDDGFYLGMLSVDPEVQNAGIGKALLKQAEAYARSKQHNKIQISVLDSRVELIAWYERHGYVKTGELKPFHYGNKFGTPKQKLQLVIMEKAI